jgi:hypothetical protein
MTRSFLAAVLVTTLLASTSACATRTQSKVATTTLGVAAGASLVSGIALYAAGEACEPDEYDSCDGNGAAYLLAAVLVGAGVALAAGAFAVDAAAPDEPEEIARQDRLVRLPPTPASAPIALPVRATDERTLQLARQAARAAAHGQCTAARVTLEQVEDRDAAYHGELRGLDVFARCL